MVSVNALNLTRVEETYIAEEILRRTSSDVVSWRELLELCRAVGVSANRLRKILLSLIEAGEVVELRCRLFTSPRLLREELREELEKRVKEAVARSGLKKCGKPLTIPIKNISVVITKTSDVSVVECRAPARSSRRPPSGSLIGGNGLYSLEATTVYSGAGVVSGAGHLSTRCGWLRR